MIYIALTTYVLDSEAVQVISFTYLATAKTTTIKKSNTYIMQVRKMFYGNTANKGIIYSRLSAHWASSHLIKASHQLATSMVANNIFSRPSLD